MVSAGYGLVKYSIDGVHMQGSWVELAWVRQLVQALTTSREHLPSRLLPPTNIITTFNLTACICLPDIKDVLIYDAH